MKTIKFNYDYSRVMMMKILLARRGHNGGTDVQCTVDEALEMIKQTDNLTQGVTKIIYLVGWQYNGHDDKYPAFFEVNEALKRPADASAKDSLLYLINEAKKYNTVVSYHINLTDAYPESPLWDRYVAENAILRKRNGKLKKTGVWAGQDAYAVRYGREIESGLFKERVDKLLDYLPVQEAGTIHADAFFVHKGKDTGVASEKTARRKMIEYFIEKGVDLTSEFIYREHNSGFRAHWGYSDTVGLIPAFWNTVLSSRDLLKYPANYLSGGTHTPALTPDKTVEWLTYGNMQGEDLLVPNTDWQGKFLKQFITYTVPYYYLNGFKREKITGAGRFRKLYHSCDVVSQIKDKKITQNGKTLKTNNDLCLPVHWIDKGYMAYSENGGNADWHVSGNTADIYSLSGSGKKHLDSVKVKDNVIRYECAAETGYLIVTK